MNMFKSNGGFTLVELIVVIAILAILAGVAVPAYSGYISKANEAADMTLLDSVKTAVVFATMEKEPEVSVTTFTVSEGEPKAISVTTTGDAVTVDITEYVKTIDFKSNNTSAVWYASKTGDYESGWTLKP